MARAQWDPGVYLSFGDHRLRPAIELLARVPTIPVRSLVDLGCGPGNVTAALLGRWPDAAYQGIDTSVEMLDRARAAHPSLDWVVDDAATWAPSTPPDLIFSNATLHWLDDHDTLYPRLLDGVAPGGVLAVQVPDNFSQPTHTCISQAVAAGNWSVDLASLIRPRPVHEAHWYHQLLDARCSSLDVWTTTYLQRLTGDDPVVSWVSGSALRPFLTALPPAEAQQFVAVYRELVSGHYPPSPDGEVLLPFTRLFLVARRH